MADRFAAVVITTEAFRHQISKSGIRQWLLDVLLLVVVP
jgi:hypothetical protein